MRTNSFQIQFSRGQSRTFYFAFQLFIIFKLFCLCLTVCNYDIHKACQFLIYGENIDFLTLYVFGKTMQAILFICKAHALNVRKKLCSKVLQ
jgi:hypothetical protein